MMSIDFNNLTLDNLHAWPLLVKRGALIGVAVFILLLGYWFDTSSQLDEWTQAQQQEQTLRREFEEKQQESVNLAGYKLQLQEMKKTFGYMLKQLPNSTEVPGLLESISKIGVATGLEFRLFKPLPEQEKDFYAELPIQITVVGSYHELGKFVSKIAGLDRIVTIQDFNIVPDKEAAQTVNSSNIDPGAKSKSRLVMDMTAMTYRYTEEVKRKKPDASAGA